MASGPNWATSAAAVNCNPLASNPSAEGEPHVILTVFRAGHFKLSASFHQATALPTMPSLTLSFSFTLSAILLLAFLASPTVAFGAGNIGERAED